MDWNQGATAKRKTRNQRMPAVFSHHPFATGTSTGTKKKKNEWTQLQRLGGEKRHKVKMKPILAKS